MKIYCQRCGSATEYSFDKPKFCSTCGNGFALAQSSPPRQRTAPPPKITQKEEEDDGPERVPDISSLEVEIEASPRKGEKFGSILGTQSASNAEERVKGGEVNKEQVLESFKKEAGFYPSRQIIDEEE